MRRWDAHQIARASGAELVRGPAAGTDPVSGHPGPDRVSIDSRDAGPGVLFVGLPGERTHGGVFAQQALDSGAWGVLTSTEHVAGAEAADARAQPSGLGAVLASEDPLVALQRLATAWRRELRAQVIGVTGSTGKTSTKDMLRGLLSPHRRTVASRANFNTEIGMPLEILSAPSGTEVLVLEMGMRGAGQIAELAQIAEPDVGVIVSIGPAHLELMGTIEAIAAAKAELIAALPVGATAIVPAGEVLLAPHLREDLKTVTFGPQADVTFASQDAAGVEIDARGAGGGLIHLDINFAEAHLRQDLLAAVAAALAVGVQPSGRLELALSPGRGQRHLLAAGIILIDDAYNGNPVSMRAALDALAATEADGRRIAVLGDMLELGADAIGFHEQIGAHADGIADILVTVGPLAAAMAPSFHGEHHHAADAEAASALLPQLIGDGDVVLVKASNGVGLKRVCETLMAVTPA